MTLTRDPASRGTGDADQPDEAASRPPDQPGGRRADFSAIPASWVNAPSGPAGGRAHNRPGPARDRRSGESTGVHGPGRARVAARTLRGDRWWLQPAVTATILLLFVAYGTWRAFENAHYFAEPYLSPFYSPCLTGGCVQGSSDLGHWVPSGLWRLSPALIILIFPLGFRLTCYYYRKAYYRAFWQSPPACAVAEPHGKYTGETRFPLILQNVHRYFFYVAILFAGLLTWDAVHSLRDTRGAWGHMGLGTVILLVNAVLIWAYTLSCHSCRHVTGGRLNSFSRHPVRYRLWTFVSRLNAHHMRFAWASLFSLVIADLYVRFLASGTFADPRFF